MRTATMVSVGSILSAMDALFTATMAFAIIAIGAAISTREYLLATTTMFLVSALVWYGISVDYKATHAIFLCYGVTTFDPRARRYRDGTMHP